MGSSTAGRIGLVKMSGTATTFTDEATTAVIANKAYQISNAVKQVWDPTFAVTVKNGGVAVDPVADPYTINRLTGTVTFTATTARTITFSGKYLPMTTIAKGTEFYYTLSRPAIDDTTFDSVNWRENVAGIADVQATIGKNWETVSAPLLAAALSSGSVLVLQFYSNRAIAADLLMWALPTKSARSVKVQDLVKASLDFTGAPDADKRSVSIA
jgi:hypothetical protein